MLLYSPDADVRRRAQQIAIRASGQGAVNVGGEERKRMGSASLERAATTATPQFDDEAESATTTALALAPLPRGGRSREKGPAKSATPLPPLSSAEGRGGSGVHIERLILHHLDHRVGALRLVEELATLDEQPAAFFAAHIAAARARADWRARFAEPAREVAALCRQLLLPGEFVGASRALAQRLYVQMRPRQIAPGDFIAIVYTLRPPDDSQEAADGRPQIALFKLEPDSRLARTSSHAGGRLRVSIHTAGNLLSQAEALQKCALLRLEAEGDFAVTLLDTQAGPRSEA
jgi:hypothetical protein